MAADLYFVFARVAALVLSPSTLFVTAVALGFVLMQSRSMVFLGRRLIGLALLGYVVFAVFPVGEWALGALEDRFPAQQDTSQAVAGIIVLGGSFDTQITHERDQVSVLSNVERLTQFIRLARANPQAALIFSGGNGRVFDTQPTEAEVARRFFDEVGFDVERVQFEDRSRNTSESARLTFAKFAPKPDETWVLVTSARHMPRAMGLFRHEGWTVTAYPVDYVLPPDAPVNFWPRWPGQLNVVDTAVYEWGGLIAARLRGRIDHLFPGPSQ
jgi:uncharacterized SAM-binding protein YcdF (DUF218 family)